MAIFRCLFVSFVFFSAKIAQCVGDETKLLAEAEQALGKAEDFIWSQLGGEGGFWPHGEAAAAIIGLSASRAKVAGGISNFEDETEISAMKRNVERVAVDFLLELRKQGDRLDRVDSTFLIQLIGVLKFTCVADPRDYYGLDLIQEVENRVIEMNEKYNWKRGEEPELPYSAMVLVLCNSGVKIPMKYIYLLSAPSLRNADGKYVPLGVERAAFNVIALKCYQVQNGYSGWTGNRYPRKISNRNLRYIYSQQGVDGGFGTVYATAMAIHADLARLTKPKYPKFNFDKARSWLIGIQKQDGSYGSSIVFTSMAISGLIDKTVDSGRLIDCPAGSESRNFAIKFVVTDMQFAKQSFVDYIQATDGQTVKNLLEQHAKDNPYSFQFRADGNSITEINGLKNVLNFATWKVDATNSKGEEFKVDIVADKVDKSLAYSLTYGP